MHQEVSSMDLAKLILQIKEANKEINNKEINNKKNCNFDFNYLMSQIMHYFFLIVIILHNFIEYKYRNLRCYFHGMTFSSENIASNKLISVTE